MGLSNGKFDEREDQCESQGGEKIGRNSNHVLSECSGNASYDSVQNLLSCSSLFNNIKTKMYKNIILLYIFIKYTVMQQHN
jgi:hypothetical protein